jgi:hypothetical protein
MINDGSFATETTNSSEFDPQAVESKDSETNDPENPIELLVMKSSVLRHDDDESRSESGNLEECEGSEAFVGSETTLSSVSLDKLVSLSFSSEFEVSFFGKSVCV